MFAIFQFEVMYMFIGISFRFKFFVECGKLDETADRNENGVIDSIDDALDLIVELKAKGYTDEHIHYLELADGKHDVPTWGKALPAFLKWGWGMDK